MGWLVGWVDALAGRGPCFRAAVGGWLFRAVVARVSVSRWAAG